MTEFEVVLYDKSGNKIKTVKEAKDKDSLKDELIKSGFVVVSIEPIRDKFSIKIDTGKIKDNDIYQLFKELSILTKSGVKIDRGLQILINSTQNKKLKEALEKILQSIKSGENLSDAFEKSNLFSPLVVSLIRASEITGELSTGFENTANYIKFQIQFKNDLKSAMVYPSFLIFASFFTIIVILKFIVPKFFSIFPDIQPENLPFLSKLILSISQAISINPVSISILAVFLFLIVLFKRKGKTYNFLQILYFVPILRDLLINLDISRFFYSMHSMLKSGIEFIKALELSSLTIQNREMRQKVLSIVDEIKKGKSVATAFSDTGVLNQSTIAMITVGEESGNLEEIFFEIYSLYDEKFKTSTKRLLTIMEPLIITITGVVVGFIVISLILTVVVFTNVKL